MREQRRKAREQSGFTLIELLIVIVILGVLAGIVVFSVKGITDRGTNSACKSDVKTVEVASEAYYAKNGSYAAGIVVADDVATPADESKTGLVGAGFLHSAPSTTNGYTIGYASATGTVTGDLSAAPVSTDCSA